MATCNAGHGCTTTCADGCGCMYVHSTRQCTCFCSGSRGPRGLTEGITLDSRVSLHFSGLPVATAANVLEKAFPGQVGLPLSAHRKKTISARVKNKKLRNALADAGFWVRESGGGRKSSRSPR